MKISKFELGNLGVVRTVEANPPAPKNFSYFGKKIEREEPEYTKTDLNAKMDDAHKKGFEEGLGKGREEITANALAVEQTTRGTVEKITLQMSEFLKSYEDEKKEFMRNMVRVSIVAIQKISQKAIAENSEEVLLQALEKSAHVFSKQPEIVFRAKKNILEKIQDKVDNILKANEFKGAITYTADETVEDGNCLLEWGKSGLSINSSEALKEIEDILSEYIKSI